MKKTIQIALFTCLIFLMSAIVFTACNKQQATHTHTEVIDPAVAPTCATAGLTQGKHCATCNEVLIAQKTTNKLAHSEVVDTGYAATCTTDGLTDGKHCYVCNEVIVKQEKIEASHVEIIDMAMPPSCTREGKTEGRHCEVCKNVIVEQVALPMLQHSYSDEMVNICDICGFERLATIHGIYINAENNTLTIHYTVNFDSVPHGIGLEVSKYPGNTIVASISNLKVATSGTYTKTIVWLGSLEESKQYSLQILYWSSDVSYNPASDMYVFTYQSSQATECTHIESESVIENNISPTCTTKGSYNSVVYCVLCGEELSREMISVDTIGHTEIVDEAIAPTCSAEGKTEGKHCSVCNEILIAQEMVDKLVHTEVVDKAIAPTCSAEGKTEGKHCSVCNEILIAQEIVDKLAHTEIVDTGYAATCTTDGLTDGKHCHACGEVIVKPSIIKATGHKLGDWIVEKEATEAEDGIRYANCTVCDKTIEEVLYATGSTIFTFTLNPDKTSYCVSGIRYAYLYRNYVIPKFYEGLPVTSIGEYAFEKCEFLVGLTIPDSVTSIGVGAFRDCTRLEKLIFKGNIPSFNYGSIPNLTTVILESGITSIGDKAFYECRSLTSITIPDSVTSIGDYAFYYCTSLANITLPNSVTSIGDDAFYCCSSIESFILPENLTSIGKYAFRYSGITSLTIPASLGVIDEYAFSHCTSLTYLTISDGIKGIGYESFSYCRSLKYVKMPTSVKKLGEYAFYNSSSIVEFEFDGTKKQWDEIKKERYWCSSYFDISCINETIRSEIVE